MNYSRGPHASSDDGTRTALLAAARDLFAERGYDGASVRAITSRAGANLGAITYHFGSKESLYNDVLTGLMAPLRDRVVAVAHRDAPALERLDGVLEAYFDHLAAHPDLPRFLLERIASGQAPPPPVAAVMSSILKAVSALLRSGQADGSIRPGDPVLQTLSLISQPVYLTLVQGPLTAVLGLDFTSVEGRTRLVEHARSFVRSGLSTAARDLP